MPERPRLAPAEAQSYGRDATPIPNYASDDLFTGGSNIGMNEFSTFLLICRCAFELMKPCRYSDLEMLAHSGRDSRKISDVQRALKCLEEAGYIHIFHTPEGRAIIPDYYADFIPGPPSTS
jgi:hypothetical protein